MNTSDHYVIGSVNCGLNRDASMRNGKLLRKGCLLPASPQPVLRSFSSSVIKCNKVINYTEDGGCAGTTESYPYSVFNANETDYFRARRFRP